MVHNAFGMGYDLVSYMGPGVRTPCHANTMLIKWLEICILKIAFLLIVNGVKLIIYAVHG